MLITIRTTHEPATDIGFLLMKNPANLHTVKLSFGDAHVFYPEVTPEGCTAALLLDIDPVALVRKDTPAGEGFALQQYVNDRPYAVSSFMSVAIAKVFGTALSGNSKHRPELADQAIPLEVTLFALPCRGGDKVLRQLFEPLGYTVDAVPALLDEKFPDWGNSAYYTVTLRRSCPLREFLTHLYVLIPVLDNDKHYFIGDDEIEKLLRFGEGWLSSHPEKKLITSRYLKNFRSLVNEALYRLSEDGVTEEAAAPGEEKVQREETLEKKINLHQQRLEWVAATLKENGAHSVADLGCGEGKLLAFLLKEKSFERIMGCDVSVRSLQIAKERLGIDRLPPMQQQRITLFQTALTYRDKRLAGYDAAVLVEVIEHLDVSRLDAAKRAIFEFTRPGMVIITTPNAEYNQLFENLPEGKFRHSDHRFEWTRPQFEDWASAIALQYGYAVRFNGIGDTHPEWGAPTQAGIFVKS